MNSHLRIFGAFSAGVVGGLLSTLITSGVAPARADSTIPAMTVRRIQFTDSRERLYARIDQDDRLGSELCFLDAKGHSRLKMGLDSHGLPFLGLYAGDDSKNPKTWLTLTGKNESSQLVLRDKWNKARLIMGIEPDAPTEEPFFVYYDKDGTKHALFGDH